MEQGQGRGKKRREEIEIKLRTFGAEMNWCVGPKKEFNMLWRMVRWWSSLLISYFVFCDWGGSF